LAVYLFFHRYCWCLYHAWELLHAHDQWIMTLIFNNQIWNLISEMQAPRIDTNKWIVWWVVNPLTPVLLDLSLHPRWECCSRWHALVTGSHLWLNWPSRLSRVRIGWWTRFRPNLYWCFGWVAETSLRIKCWLLHIVWCCYGSLVACVAYGELGMVLCSWYVWSVSHLLFKVRCHA
jgi:hypothetical protein